MRRQTAQAIPPIRLDLAVSNDTLWLLRRPSSMKKWMLLFGLLLATGFYSCKSSTPLADGASQQANEETPALEVPDAAIPNEVDTGSTGSLEPDTVEVTPEGFPFVVSTFATSDLIEANAGGCGMSLWRVGESPMSDGLLFFHGIDEAALMMFDGEFQTLDRTEASGEEFYGQQSEQTFETVDGQTTVRVSVTLGEPGEIESIGISDGTLAIETEGIATEIPVVGDAGC